MKNSCGGKRGCEYNFILPNDGKFQYVFAGMLQAEHGIQAIFSLPKSEMDSELEKKRPVEKKNIKANGSMYLLPVSMDSFNFLLLDLQSDRFQDASKYRINVFNN